jgi:hypothetical protein
MTILSDVKAAIGIVENETMFDPQLLQEINFAGSVATQLGAEEFAYFAIDESTDWPAFTHPEVEHICKSLVTARVLRNFDPTPSATINDIRDRNILELENRLMFELEGG